MMRRIGGFAAVCAFAAAGLAACAALPGRLTAARVLRVGDSTMAPVTGYGDALCTRFRVELSCSNLAHGGRSSKSYREEGLWARVIERLAEPGFAATYVLIQFGHNDQPGKPGRSTTLDEFRANPRRFEGEVREHGATPVLVTPLTRRSFKDGRLVDGLGAWADAARDVARETRTPLLDLHAASVRAVQKMGVRQALALAELPPPREAIEAARSGNTVEKPMAKQPGTASAKHVPAFDYTHLGPAGAELFSGEVAAEIRVALPALAPFLRE